MASRFRPNSKMMDLQLTNLPMQKIMPHPSEVVCRISYGRVSLVSAETERSLYVKPETELSDLQDFIR